MDIKVPKCIQNNRCYAVCSTQNCRSIPFLCRQDDCQCSIQHKKCHLNLTWINLCQSLKVKNSSNQINEYVDKVQDIYKMTLKQIQRAYNKMKHELNDGSSERQKEVIMKMKEKRFNELDGSCFASLVKQFKTQRHIKVHDLTLQKQLISQATQKLIKLLTDLIKQQQASSVNQTKDKLIDKDVISHFFNKKLKKINRLYRASQNNFQASKFWDKCNGKSNTLTVVKTQFNKIIGGYTPLAWNKQLTNQYQWDPTNQTFVFSLTQNDKLQLRKNKENFAIFHLSDGGPSFGGGKDLQICDKANVDSNSYSSIGHTFKKRGQYAYNKQESFEKFSGQSKGNNFLVDEWEVYEVIFDV